MLMLCVSTSALDSLYALSSLFAWVSPFSLVASGAGLSHLCSSTTTNQSAVASVRHYRSASCLVVLVVDDDESACDVAIESSLTKNCFQNDHSKVMA